MQRSAEWLRGEKAALRRLKPEVWGQGFKAYNTRDLRQLVDSDYFKAERELAAAEARESFPIPDTLPAVSEASEAGKPTAAEVIAACEKHISDTLEGMPDKIDPRIKYREFQYHDYELDEMRKLLNLCAQWKEANHGK